MKKKNGLIVGLVGGIILASAPYDSLPDNVVSSPFRSKIEEKVISPGNAPLESIKNALYLQIREFGDNSRTSWNRDFSGTSVVFQEPPNYTAQKWNALTNPRFCVDSKDGGGYSTRDIYQSNVPEDEVHSALTKDKINHGQDRIYYTTVMDPRDIPEYLRTWKGPKLDRLIINAHGSSTSLGQNKIIPTYIRRDELLANYKPGDFKHVMKKEGHIFLEACSTNEGFDKDLSMAESIAYLFNTPTTGALQTALFFKKGMQGPACSINANDSRGWLAQWFNSDGSANVQSVTFTPHKTVYPNPAEVKAYLSNKAR
ncbi:MAG: hypothetical protein Q7R87_00210 [Nanoarchaeota archaeon]|nr:hypothetical protein [Nanoarchaeota archaeon]